MKKIAVVYYSGTGNTEALANALVEGAQESGASVKVISAGMFSSDMLDSYDAFAFGCPAMGSEALEDEVFEPMFESLLEHLAGRKVALFGSYGWGDGEWMQNWETDCKDSGLTLAHESVICMEAPDEATLSLCREIGATLSKEE